MGFTESIKNIIADPAIRMDFLTEKGLYNHMPDERFLKKKYKLKMGYELDLSNPQTFNEKIQWLKLNDRRPEYTMMVDKYEVKKYVAEKIGEEHIIPTLGVWNRFDDINFDNFPNQFVLKCTHDSGGIVICKDKSNFDKEVARAKINKCLRRNFYWIGREWPYKNVKPRIIAEKYMVNESGCELKDYKVFNFNGEPKLIQVDYYRFINHMRNLYTTEWEFVEVEIEYPLDNNKQIDKPQKLEQMLDLAAKLSEGIPHIRTDFYAIDDKIFFGELTFSHGSGMERYTPESLNLELGQWLVLPSGVLIKDENFLLWLRTDNTQTELTDYKFMCFDGNVKCSFIVTERFSKEGLRIDFFDRDWKRLPFTRHYPSSKKEIKKPEKYEEMVELAEQLSANIPFVRVDFYQASGIIFFGEMTFYPGNGMEEFNPFEWDYILGSWLKLPRKRC